MNLHQYMLSALFRQYEIFVLCHQSAFIIMIKVTGLLILSHTV